MTRVTSFGLRMPAMGALLVLLLQAGSPLQAGAQTASLTDSLSALPPLNRVIEAAVQNSPRAGETRALLEKNKQLVDRASKIWMDGITVGVQSTAGTYGNTNIDQLNVGHTAAASIRFSLFDLFAQRDQKKIMRYELEVSREMIRKAELEETQLIVGMYHRVENALRQVAVRADSWRSSQIHREMAELEFSDGNITVAELARVSEIEAKAHSDYLAAVADFRSWYGQLEVRAGVPLSSLN